MVIRTYMDTGISRRVAYRSNPGLLTEVLEVGRRVLGRIALRHLPHPLLAVPTRPQCRTKCRELVIIDKVLRLSREEIRLNI